MRTFCKANRAQSWGARQSRMSLVSSQVLTNVGDLKPRPVLVWCGHSSLVEWMMTQVDSAHLFRQSNFDGMLIVASNAGWTGALESVSTGAKRLREIKASVNSVANLPKKNGQWSLTLHPLIRYDLERLRGFQIPSPLLLSTMSIVHRTSTL